MGKPGSNYGAGRYWMPRSGQRNTGEAKHFLVIDEINRGNLAKVFGELYFLLEYRDKGIRLQYSDETDEPFSLPGTCTSSGQ